MKIFPFINKLQYISTTGKYRPPKISRDFIGSVSFPPPVKNGSEAPPTPPITVKIEDIGSERKLLEHLRAGDEVILYRAFKQEYLPTPGQVYDRPFCGKTENQKFTLRENPIEAAIETIREESFSRCTPRFSSVFAAPTPAEAGKWGEVYEISIRLRPGMQEKATLPVRWLDRTFFEASTLFIRPGISREEIIKYGKENIRKYLASHGRPDGPSDILIDPVQVEITVLRKHIPDSSEKIRTILSYIFDDDPAGMGIPIEIEDLQERMENYQGQLDAESFATLRREAIKKLIAGLKEDFPRVENQRVYCHAFNICISRNGEGWYINGVNRTEECLKPEFNPYTENDPEYRELLSLLQIIKKAVNQTGHLVYLSYLHELGFSDTFMELGHFKQWEEDYKLACQIGGVKPDEEQLQEARKNYTENARKHFSSSIEQLEEETTSYDSKVYLFGKLKNSLEVIREFDTITEKEINRTKILLSKIKSEHERKLMRIILAEFI